MEREGWTIDIDAAGTPADDPEAFDRRLVAFEDALEPFGAAVATNAERDRFGARFSFDTDSVSPLDVLESGLTIFHDAADAADMPIWQVVRCEILTYAEDDAEHDGDDDLDELDDEG
jgi:hypothetical protein